MSKIQDIEQECSLLTSEEEESGDDVDYQSLDKFKFQLEDLMKQEQEKFSCNLNLITQSEELDLESQQLVIQEEQIASKFNTRYQDEHAEQEQRQIELKERQEIEQKIQRKFVNKLVTKFFQAVGLNISQLKEDNPIEQLNRIEKQNQNNPLNASLNPSTQKALSLMKIHGYCEIHDLAQNIAYRVSEAKALTSNEESQMEIDQCKNLIESINREVKTQNVKIIEINDIVTSIKNSQLLSVSKDFESSQKLSSLKLIWDNYNNMHEKSVQEIHYLSFLSEYYEKIIPKQDQELNKLFKELQKTLQNFKLLDESELSNLLNDLHNLQDNILQKFQLLPRITLLVRILQAQLMALPNIPSSLEIDYSQYLKKVADAQETINSIPTSTVTFQSLLVLESSLKDIDIDFLKERLTENQEQERLSRLNEYRGQRDQRFRDRLSNRQRQIHRQKVKHEVSQLQNQLKEKDATNYLVSIKLKGLSDEKIEVTKNLIIEAIIGINKQLEEKSLRELQQEKDKQLRKELSEIQAECSKINKAIKEELKVYDSKNAEIAKVIQDLMLCPQLFESNEEIQEINQKLEGKLKQKRLSLNQTPNIPLNIESIEDQIREAKNYQLTLKQNMNGVIDLSKRLKKESDKLNLDTIFPQLVTSLQDNINQINANIYELSDDTSKLAKLTQNTQEQNQQVQTLQKFLMKIQSDMQNEIQTKFKQLRKNQDQQLQLSKACQLGLNLGQKKTDIQNLKDQIKFMLGKFQDQEIAQRIIQIEKNSASIKDRLDRVANLIEIISELCDEFSGYCSDNYEEDLVKKLQNSDLREISTLLRMICDDNDTLTDKINYFNRKLNLQKDSNNNITLKDIEETIIQQNKDITEIEKRVARIAKSFENIPAVTKLQIRESEVTELDRKMSQLEIMIERILEESKTLVEKYQKQEDKEEIIQEMNEIRDNLNILLKDITERLHSGIVNAKQKILQIQQSTDQNHFQSLKLNKNLKKYILQILKMTKESRHQFQKLKAQYEGCKLKFRPQPRYIPFLGDDVDKLLADWVTSNNCPIPIARMGSGYYQFGSKKVYAKITNGKLLIRVGGGYMGIDEFMYYYGAQELNKMLAYDEIEFDEDSQFGVIVKREENKSNIISEFADGRAVIGGQQLKKRLSPRSNLIAIDSKNKSPRLTQGKGSPRQQPSSISQKAVLKKSSAQRINSPRSQMSLQVQSKSSQYVVRPSSQANLFTNNVKTTPQPFKEINIDDLSLQSKPLLSLSSSRSGQQPQLDQQEDIYSQYLKQNIAEVNFYTLPQEEIKENESTSQLQLNPFIKQSQKEELHFDKNE